jgi:NAD(P)H-flavin reductase/hemoglobin-like flavoprotein
MTIGLSGLSGRARAERPARRARWPGPGLPAEPSAVTGPGRATPGEGPAQGAGSGRRAASPAGGDVALSEDAAPPPVTGPDWALSPCDSRLLKKSLAVLEPQSEKVMAYFFATLFVRNPELRPMFPLTLEETRRSVFAALTRCAWSFDQPEALHGWLTELGRDHRKFGVAEHHYRAFCDALLATVQAFSAEDSWSGQTQTAWERALGWVAAAMTGGAAAMTGGAAAVAGGSAAGEPAWWLAEVVEHDRRCPDLAVLTLRPDQPLPYRAGQHVSVQVPRWPRVWREYSAASAPAPDGLLRLHVRAVPAGGVSAALVHGTRAGDTVLLGRARGDMTAEAVRSGRVVCVAGGTGLAPVKAIADALTSPARASPPEVRLFFGARTRAGLYDLPALRELASARPSLTVVPVVTGEPGYEGLAGPLPEVAAAHLLPGTGDIVISGPPGMVAATAAALAARAPGARIHADPQPGDTPSAGPAGAARPL